MIEKNREEQAAEARVSKMLAEALAEDLGDIPKVSITVEELKALERADRRKRRKRKLRYFSMAAAAVLICVVALYALWPETAVPVSADKNTEHRVEEKDGMVVINEGDVEGGSEMVEIQESNWNNVENLRKDVPQLAIPRYIPEEYEFESLHIEKHTDIDFIAKYKFKNGKQILRIEQRYYKGGGAKAITSKGKIEEIETANGTIYIISEYEEPLIVAKYLEEETLLVVGNTTKDVLIKTMNKINTELPY